MENHSTKTGGFRVSDQAAEKFKEIIDSMEERPAGVRIYNASGCCGASVQMELAEGLRPGEMEVDVEGVPFFVASDFLPELSPVTIDFTDGGFRLLGFQKSEGCCGGH
jgi:Fe-S cluster assembly iron-binding protein IscA